MNWSNKALRIGVVLLLLTAPAVAQMPEGAERPGILDAIGQAVQPQQISTTLSILILLTVLSLAPAILVMTTSFTRIVVVLGFLRQAMATQQSPPAQVIVGLSLFVTFFVMAPTYQEVYEKAYLPYRAGEFETQQEALDAALRPMRTFMFRQTRPEDMRLFMNVAKLPRPNTFDDVPNRVLVPSFVISELATAFEIGFIIYIPFLIIDMVVASTLMSMGMMMLPPVFVSLPFKIALFVLVDGWNLLIETLVRSFH